MFLMIVRNENLPGPLGSLVSLEILGILAHPGRKTVQNLSFFLLDLNQSVEIFSLFLSSNPAMVKLDKVTKVPYGLKVRKPLS